MTDNVAAPAASPAPATTITTGAPPAAPPAWHAALSEPVRGMSAAKAYDLTDPAKAYDSLGNSYINLEKMIGADRAGRTVVLPSEETDVEGWAKVHAKLGRPENPQGYQLPVPDGQDKAFAVQASAWMFEAGIPKKAAQHIAAKWNEHIAQAMQAQQQAEATKLAEEHAALAKDWGTGDAAAVQREMARRGAAALGLDEGAINALEKVSGYSKTMKALAKMGSMTGERPPAGLDVQGGGFGAMTPENAKAALASRSQDKEWGAKAMKPGTTENAEWKRLRDIVASAAAKQG
jgi:hypothetical protein